MGKIAKKIEKILEKERSPKQLALSCAIGVGIALSPYLGIQTLLIFGLSWIFGLNTTIVFIFGYVINNPWTMLPIVIIDYLVGSYLIRSLLGLNLLAYDPHWARWFMQWLDNKVGHYMHGYIKISEISFWTYMIGGHIVAVLGAFAAYPIAKIMFTRMINKLEKIKQ